MFIIFIMLYIILLVLIYRLTGSLYLLTPPLHLITALALHLWYHKSDLIFYDFVCFENIIDLQHYVSSCCTA